VSFLEARIIGRTPADRRSVWVAQEPRGGEQLAREADKSQDNTAGDLYSVVCTDPPAKTVERSLTQILSKDIDDFSLRISESLRDLNPNQARGQISGLKTSIVTPNRAKQGLLFCSSHYPNQRFSTTLY